MSQGIDATKSQEIDLDSLILGVVFSVMNSTYIKLTVVNNGVDPNELKLKRGFLVYILEKGAATAMSGAVVIALPGTKVRANSRSVVISYDGAEVVARKGAFVISAKPFVQKSLSSATGGSAD